MTIRYTRVRGKGQRRFQIKGRLGDTTSRAKVTLKIKKGDLVMVIRGDDKGKQGKVLRTIPLKGQVVVQAVNYVWRHLRRTQQNPQGGRIQKEAPIPVSAVMVIDETTKEPTRIYRATNEAGKRLRYGKTSKKPVNANETGAAS